MVSYIFDPDYGRLAALEIKPSLFLSPVRYLAEMDVQSYEQHAMIVKGDGLVDLGELPRIKDVIKSNRPILGQKAETADHEMLGRVREINFDDQTGRIVQMHIGSIVSSRIYRYQDIIEITKKFVIVKENMAKLDVLESKNTRVSAEISPV